MQFRFRFIFLLAILVVGLAGAEPATNSVALAGVVHDPSGAVIVGAKVELTLPDGKVAVQGVTDAAGIFRFTNLNPGNYSINVTQLGFRENKQQVKVSPTMHSQLQIVLPIALVNEEVTVTGADTSTEVTTEAPQNQDATVIDREALDRLPVFDQDYITTMSRFLNSDATGTNGITLVVNGDAFNSGGLPGSQSIFRDREPGRRCRVSG
jgi:hypothetical protein